MHQLEVRRVADADAVEEVDRGGDEATPCDSADPFEDESVAEVSRDEGMGVGVGSGIGNADVGPCGDGNTGAHPAGLGNDAGGDGGADRSR